MSATTPPPSSRAPTGARIRPHTRGRLGFTMIEIMLVVIIIGLLAAIGLPVFKRARENAMVGRLANDWRLYEGAYQLYSLDHRQWAVDGYPGTVPAGMEGYLASDWSNPGPNGGYWDWEYDTMGVTAGISLHKGAGFPEVFNKVDAAIDDGNLGSGRFIENGDRYTLVLEP